MPGSEHDEALAAVRSLANEWGFDMAPEQTDLLLEFAALLIRWNQSINLTGARYDGQTRWPKGFDPHRLGAVKVSSSVDINRSDTGR